VRTTKLRGIIVGMISDGDGDADADEYIGQAEKEAQKIVQKGRSSY
jgi:hypothetical protein